MEKLLYITYDFNFKKTASSRFFYDFLCQHYEVETISPINEEINYDEINSKNYFCIVSFYFMADFSKFTCNNLIFVPMYDGFSYSYKKVKILKNVKIINFCKYLHKLSKLFGLNSIYLQYYPKLMINEKEERNILFYWQRRDIPFSSIKKCLPNNISTIGVEKTILHSATDGNIDFISPNDDDIEKYKICITNWFENKSDLECLLNKTLYYVAPRMQEGIGLSFLDAMSRGCVIIANNDRTMNEYIKNGKNGYLIDFENIKQIKFKDFERIQEESIKIFVRGREKYLNKLPQIVNFINQKTCKKLFCGGIVFIYFVIKKIISKIN